MTPDEHTNQEFFLDVGDGHQLYVQDWGNKDIKTPILFILGGPGGALGDKHKQPFDPRTERVIFYDQRGCGKSLPYGSLEHNTTQDMVEDIAKIGDKLGIRQFILVGGSWGAALSFFFAIRYPERVKAMVLNGIWTGSTSENDWVDKGGFRNFYPDAWERYVQSVPQKYHANPSSYHFPRILGDDEAAIKESAYAYENLEGSAISLDDRHLPEPFDEYDPAGVRIEVHYLVNKCFVPDGYVFKHAAELTMPVWLVQGRYDMVCPPITAYNLSKLLPNSHLVWTTSGHKTERESWNIIRTLLLQITQD